MFIYTARSNFCAMLLFVLFYSRVHPETYREAIIIFISCWQWEQCKQFVLLYLHCDHCSHYMHERQKLRHVAKRKLTIFCCSLFSAPILPKLSGKKACVSPQIYKADKARGSRIKKMDSLGPKADEVRRRPPTRISPNLLFPSLLFRRAARWLKQKGRSPEAPSRPFGLRPQHYNLLNSQRR